MRRLLIAAALIGQGAAARAEPADMLVHAVPRGAILTDGDFERRDVPAAQAKFALAAAQAIGREARRMLPAGTLLRPGDIAPPTLVRRGDAVSVTLRSGAITIGAPGRVLADGGSGDVVRVVNLATGRTLDARVRAAGAVEVAAP